MLSNPSRSTKNVTVFALNQEDKISKKILFAKATREELISKFLKTTNEEEKIIFFKHFDYLYSQLRGYLEVTERIYIYLDNNVLQDIFSKESNAQRKIRFFSFLTILCYAEDYLLIDIFAFIAPSVVYEYSGRGKSSIEETLNNITHILADIGLKTFFPFNTDKRNVSRIFELIEKDQNEIIVALNTINNKSWKRDFKNESEGIGVRIPFSLAEEECPELNLYYFEAWVVKYILMLRIENMMYRENKDDKVARKMMNSPINSFYSIVNNKGDHKILKGLGDIELLSTCDLLSQTNSNSPTIAMGITFDRDLQTALASRSRIVSSTSFDSDADEPEEAIARFMYIHKILSRKDGKLRRRCKSYAAASALFIKNVFRNFQ